MLSLPKKIILSTLVFLVLIFGVFPNFAAAKIHAATWYTQSFPEWFGKVYDPNTSSELFGERYTAAQVQWIIYGLISFILNPGGSSQIAEIEHCFISNAGSASSCVTELEKLIADNSATTPNVAVNTMNDKGFKDFFLADRPLSGVSYFREKLRNFNLVPTAHAQTIGFGFKALDTVQDMWRASRDIAFGLFIIVAIIFAFMIMFRVKLSPQTVVTVQSALPKIILALILATFSYAIAGLLVDLMYVVIGMLSMILGRFWGASAVPGIFNPTKTMFNLLVFGQPFGLGIQAGIFGLMGVYLGVFCIGITVILMANPILGAALAIGTLLNLLNPIGAILGLLLAIVAVVVIIVHFFKTVWSLLKAYVAVLLLVIFAPIQLTLGAVIPSLGFGAWVKSMAANLSTFVVTGGLLLMAFIFLIKGVQLGISDNFAWKILGFISAGLGLQHLPGGTGSAGWPPLLGGSGGPTTGILFLGVSFVLFTLIPKASDIIKGFISGKPFAYGTAIGEAVAPVGWMAGKAISSQPAQFGIGSVEQKFGGELVQRYEGLPQLEKDRFTNKLLNFLGGTMVASGSKKKGEHS
jgi:hypothetical protein